MSILILSHKHDHSTADVMDWIYCLGGEVTRINYSSVTALLKAEIGSDKDIVILVENKEYKISDFNSFWYRNGNINFNNALQGYTGPADFSNEVMHHLHAEARALSNLIIYKLEQKKRIGSFNLSEPNKLIVLEMAKLYGLQTPHTLITSRKDQLVEFHKITKNLIYKAISDSISVKCDDGYLGFFTERLTESILNQLPQLFFPTLFQEEITKKYELRIFYLEDKFYPMAIFSQNDSSTQVDFRRYNKAKPNRTVPYSLPKVIVSKLLMLTKAMNINSGSIDMIVDNNNNYVFLEINPVGQYGMVSHPCNYFIDKKIAQFLVTCENSSL